MTERLRVSSGVSQLDRLLGGLYIGDNVVWLDDAGSLASVFCLSFVQASQTQNRHLIYVTVDRSPKNLLDKLGTLAQNPNLTILDCFTYGKGAGEEVFTRFYDERDEAPLCRVVPVNDPRQPSQVSEALYSLHGQLEGDVRFVVESLTGMQELWGGEEAIISFYSHACPRLYELNTVAYWVIEKNAHSQMLKAQIAQIAQVVIDLTIKRGTTSLTILKAEKRPQENHHRPHTYWSKDLNVTFHSEQRISGHLNLGLRLKELRTKKGLSQTDLAKLVGVTPSTISQVESNLIYPSLPALLKMAEVLSVDIASFFQEKADDHNRMVFPAGEAVEVRLPDLPEKSLRAWMLVPVDFEAKGEPYLIEISPETSLNSHFFVHKGEEMGYVLAGKLQVKLKKAARNLKAGDVIYLTTEMPTAWSNLGRTAARLLWVKYK
jgi:transcriptional regulator with XRE-family HTH domain/KaiC/GvpD/RAD55 family RecA-like ATPase